MIHYPILRRLANERALVASCAGVALDGVTASADKVVELRQLDDKAVPVVLVEWTFL